MRRLRPKHLPIFLAWGSVLAILVWLGTHPGLMAPYASKLVSRHLLRMDEGGLRVRDFRVRAFEGMDLYGVSVTLVSPSGGLTLISADTVTVDFSVSEAMASAPRLRRVVVANPRIYIRSGQPDSTSGEANDSEAPGPRLPAVILDHLVVRDALLEFTGADGRVRERIEDLDWQGSMTSDRGVHLLLRGCSLNWKTHNSILTQIRGEVRIDDEGVSVDRLHGLLNGSSVRVKSPWSIG